MRARMRPEIDFAGGAIQGRRDDQEDYHIFEPMGNRLLLVIADGAGGQASGEVASHQATRGFIEHFTKSEAPTVPTLFTALQESNRRLTAHLNGKQASAATMATTLLAVVADGPALHWISVGDSPLLLFRDGNLERLNADHSLAPHVTGPSRAREILRSALVGGPIAMIDWRRQPCPLQDGDIIIAASDGLWTLTPKEIAETLSEHAGEPAKQLVLRLLRLVESKGKPDQDNFTIAVMKASA